ncbi:MAG: hypothetical protein HPY71_08125 [Firmicutes bacterium]|nr:hypothetical protein [Bacillota bacterium]
MTRTSRRERRAGESRGQVEARRCARVEWTCELQTETGMLVLCGFSNL